MLQDTALFWHYALSANVPGTMEPWRGQDIGQLMNLLSWEKL